MPDFKRPLNMLLLPYLDGDDARVILKIFCWKHQNHKQPVNPEGGDTLPGSHAALNYYKCEWEVDLCNIWAIIHLEVHLLQ